jgi:hypothetical protein
LTVTENAPPRVTCPVCLSALVNPASPLSGVPRPVPVIPLDRQVERDTRWVSYLVYGLLALLAFAAIMTLGRGNARNGSFVVLLVGGLATTVYFLSAARADARPPQSPAGPHPSSPEPPPMPGPGGSVMLEYGTRQPLSRPSATAGAVLAGFFSAIGVCALGVYILTITAGNPGRSGSAHNSNVAYLGGVVMMVLLYIIGMVPVSQRWRGFLPGAISGLCLGMLALGPCAACYLLTIK